MRAWWFQVTPITSLEPRQPAAEDVLRGRRLSALTKELLTEGCKAAGVEVWAYCLMPNHVHLILVPQDPDGLRAALGEAHRRYTRMINARKGWTGYLWQGRFRLSGDG